MPKLHPNHETPIQKHHTNPHTKHHKTIATTHYCFRPLHGNLHGWTVQDTCASNGMAPTCLRRRDKVVKKIATCNKSYNSSHKSQKYIWHTKMKIIKLSNICNQNHKNPISTTRDINNKSWYTLAVNNVHCEHTSTNKYQIENDKLSINVINHAQD